MLERDYQAKLIRKLKTIFPGCKVFKTDPTHRQGYPDLIILCGYAWAALEIKRDPTAPVRPNQRYHIDEMNNMGGFASFINPATENDVLRELRYHFHFGGAK